MPYLYCIGSLLVATGPPNGLRIDVHSGVIARTERFGYIGIGNHIAVTIGQTKRPTVGRSSGIIGVGQAYGIATIDETAATNIVIGLQLFVT